MNNVVHHNFNYKAPEGYTPDERYDLGAVALLMSVRSQLDTSNDTTKAILRNGEAGITTVFPLIDLMSSIYGDLSLPHRLTSDHGVRTQNSNENNYSVLFTHYPQTMLKDMGKMLEQGITPNPTLQIEVSYSDYAEGESESALFTGTDVPQFECLSLDPCLNNESIEHLHANLAHVVRIHGGFMGKGRSDDDSRACLIGMIPMMGRAYIRLAIVFKGEVKDVN